MTKKRVGGKNPSGERAHAIHERCRNMPAHAKAIGKTERRPFRAHNISGEALAIDPGAGGLIASVLRGAQPSPQAFGFFYDVPRPLRFVPEAYTDNYGNVVPSSVEDGVAVLCLDGPLEHHDQGMSWGPHSYECLTREIQAALDCGAVEAVVLKMDSPGGVAAGMGEAHKRIRTLVEAYGKPVYAFADEMACSAAYHLASACSEVWTTPAGHVGSVGVILCTIDETKALDKAGVSVDYVVSGARKADLHPGSPVTEQVRAVAQAKVDKLAGQFFRAVASARGKAPGGSALADAAAVQALQAGVFVGDDAVAAGLADGIASWPEFIGYVKRAIRMGQAA